MNRINWVTFAIAGGLLLGSAAAVFTLGYSEAARADAAYDTKNYASAAISYARAAQLLPWPALKRDDLWEKAGIAATLADDFSNAVLYLRKPQTLSEQGWMNLGFSYSILGDIPAALRTLEEGAQIHDSAGLYYLLGWIHRLEKNWPAEQHALENQVRVNEQDAYAHYRLGLLFSTHDPQHALTELKTAAALDKQFEPAVESMRTALNIADTQDDESQKLVTIGRALGLVQEWDLAAAAFQLAIDADAANAEAWAWLGEAEQQTGKDGSAALDQALALDKQSPIVRGLRAQQWSRLGEYERMRAEYSIAARLEPENAAWQAALGEANLKLGDLAAAIGFYKRATELAPENATYWRLLAMTCAENGVAVEDVALPAAQKAAMLSPNDPVMLDTLGFTYYSSGRYANAEDILKSAIQLDKQYWPAHLHLAMNYLVQGDKYQAYLLLTQVRDADAGVYGEQAQRMLAQYFP
jgi:tetratricopeptide (TPR) repeat protein